MRGEIKLKILENIGEFSIAMVDLVGAILRSGYGASISKIDYELFQSGHENKAKSALGLDRSEKQGIYNMISYLKKEGFIKKESKNGNFVSLTKKGFGELKKLGAFIRNKKKREVLYKLDKNIPKLNIIAFDIPESKKDIRAWLRNSLVFMGFEMMQKSVWSGEGKIPVQFIKDIYYLGVADFIDIFEVTKSGTLKRFFK